MNGRREDRSELERIDADAAKWIVLRDRGLSPQEQDEYLEWLAANPLHGERYARQGRSWAESNLLAEWRPEHSDEPNPDLLASKAVKPRWFRWRWELGSVAAVACLIAYFSGGFSGMEPNAAEEQVTRVVSQSYAYQVLDDGSEIDLNEGAEVSIRYTDEKRLVTLTSGEAHFTVAKDPDRPFVVSVDGTEIIAVGTAFNVRREAEALELLVTEGKVRWEAVMETEPRDLDTGGNPLAFSQEVESGQRSMISLKQEERLKPSVAEVSQEEIDQMLRWKPVLFDFDSTPLAVAVDQFNQRNETKLALADETIGDQLIVASLRSNKIDEFVRLLDLALGIKSRRDDEGRILLFTE